MVWYLKHLIYDSLPPITGGSCHKYDFSFLSRQNIFVLTNICNDKHMEWWIRIHFITHTHTPRHTHAHTYPDKHTHCKYMHYWWWIGKKTNQYAEEMRCVFSFDLKEESEDECLTERGRVFRSTGPMYCKDLSRGPPTHPRDTEDASIRSWVKRARRVEMK